MRKHSSLLPSHDFYAYLFSLSFLVIAAMSLSILASPKIFIRLANVIGYNMLMQILVLDLIIALVFVFWFLVLIGYGWQAVDKLASKYVVIYI